MFGWWRKRQKLSEKNAIVDAANAHDLAMLFGGKSAAGVAVNTDRALQVAVVLACVRVIAEGIAQLPLKVMRESVDSAGRIVRTPARDLQIYRLLHRRPNFWQTSFDFRETLTMHAVLTGNGYAYINRVGNEVRELIPLMPAQVQVEQMPDYGLVYRVSLVDGEQLVLRREDVLHIRAPSWNSYLGMDSVRYAREAIGLAIATEQAQAKIHANGGRLSGLLSTDQKLNADAIERLRTQWAAKYAGSANAGQTAVLDAGFKFTAMSMTAEDAQTMEARRFQVEEVCREFRVFPQMVMQADKAATYASAEQFFLAHVIHSLGPWIERWEQAIDRDLLGGDLYAHMAVQGLLRGASRDRAEYYTRLYQIGAMNPNEIRANEDLPPYDGGDEFRVPLNMEQPGKPGDDDANQTP